MTECSESAQEQKIALYKKLTTWVNTLWYSHMLVGGEVCRVGMVWGVGWGGLNWRDSLACKCGRYAILYLHPSVGCFCLYLYERSIYLLDILAPVYAAMLVHSLLVESRKRLVRDVLDDFATHTSLLHGFSGTDFMALSQNGSSHSHVSVTFVYVWNFGKHDEKLSEKLRCVYFYYPFSIHRACDTASVLFPFNLGEIRNTEICTLELLNTEVSAYLDVFFLCVCVCVCVWSSWVWEAAAISSSSISVPCLPYFQYVQWLVLHILQWNWKYSLMFGSQQGTWELPQVFFSFQQPWEL